MSAPTDLLVVGAGMRTRTAVRPRLTIVQILVWACPTGTRPKRTPSGTAAPGQVGNFAVAGVRGLHGPFARLTELAAGDEVIVETASAVYTYALTNNPVELTVTDTDTWVLQPVPAQPEVRPSQALLTLTTSQDLFRSDTRTVAFGALVSTQSK